MTIRGESNAAGTLIVVLMGISLLLGLETIVRAQRVGENWPSRTVQMPAPGSRGLAPVITAVCLQPDGQLLAVAGDDHLIYLWDLARERIAQRLTGHTDWVHSVRYSPAGELLASAGHDGRVILWNPTVGKPIGVLERRPQAVTELAWSHDGSLLAVTCSVGKLRVHDVRAQKRVAELEGPSGDLRALAFSPDDNVIAAGGRSGVVRLWRRQNEFRAEDYRPHTQRIRALTFSPDGRLLLSSGDDRKIHVRSLETGRGYDLPPRPAKVFALTFVGPHYLAAGGSDNLIRLWDLSNAKEVGRLYGHQGSVATLDCDENVLVSGGYDTLVRIWTIKDRVAEVPRDVRGLK